MGTVAVSRKAYAMCIQVFVNSWSLCTKPNNGLVITYPLHLSHDITWFSAPTHSYLIVFFLRQNVCEYEKMA